MPIGKNAIKRVENNGYSNVKTTAPDMVNSTVIGATAPEVIKMVEKSVETQAPKKEAEVAPVKTTAKKTTTTTKKSTAKKAAKKEDTFSRCAFGEDLPYYLL